MMTGNPHGLPSFPDPKGLSPRRAVLVVEGLVGGWRLQHRFLVRDRFGHDTLVVEEGPPKTLKSTVRMGYPK